MKRPILRLSIFAVTLLAASAPFLAARAEHRPFYSRLNPKTWFKKDDAKSKSVEEPKTAKATANSSVRPYLKEDPFSDPVGEADRSGANTIREVPEIVTNNRPGANTPQFAPSLKNSGSASAKPSASVDDEFMPFPRSESANNKRSAPSDTADVSRPRSKPAVPSSSGSPFEDGFDQNFAKLVDEAQRESGATKRPRVEPEPSREVAADSPKETPRPARPGFARIREETKPRVREYANSPIDDPDAVNNAVRSDFEQFMAERDGNIPAKKPRIPTESVAEESTQRRQELDRRVRSFVKDEAIEESDDTQAPAEARIIISDSRRRLEESSALKNSFAQEDTDTDSPRLTQTSGTEARRERYTPANNPATVRSRPSEPVVTSKPTYQRPTNQEMPLIVPNEMVPDRKAYLTTRSSGTNNRPLNSTSNTERRDESAPRNNTSINNDVLAAPLVSRPSAPALPALPEVTPRASANQSPALSVPEPTPVRQLSFNEHPAIEPRLPLLSIGSSAAESSKESGLLFPTDSDSKLPGAKKTESAPPIDWPDPAESVAKPKQGNALVTLGIIAAGIAAAGVVLRKKLATATASTTSVGDSPESQS